MKSVSIPRMMAIVFIIVCFGIGAFGQELTLSDKITERFHGPFHFRFIFQPLLAIILGAKDGLTDARLGKPPYFLDLFTNRLDRQNKLKQSFHSIAKPLLIGICLDAIVQLHLFHSLHLYGALLVGGVLVGLPYALARGIGNRIMRIKSKVK